ncbi:molybdopterin-synthase adenylyltransferase MoeB [Nibricoccus sp. IMCC34717]|uniref:molybdopterin-synthase adenylyltransferase MoeB n=1 Tax=Nibricoccus sp. IMCC34717 TaxID=3034021 RepID=UPI00384F3BD6
MATHPLSPDELARYSRHILLPEVGLAGQQRICASKILIIGAGGLGSPAALYLAAAGVGTLGIADFDSVELHNLQRQILHRTGSVGRAKLESAAETLVSINPHCRVVLHPQGVTPDNALSLFAGYDVIVDGSDNFATRFLNNDAAFFARKPLVYGSIFKFEGQVSVFAPHLGGPCYRCLFPEPPAPGSVPTCGEAGVIGALCGVIGSMQALEALKLVAGFGEPLLGRLLTYDGLRQRFTTLQLPRDSACPLCGDAPRIHKITTENYTWSCTTNDDSMKPSPSGQVPAEISVQDARKLLDTPSAETVLIDVREPHEAQIASIRGAKLIPMGEVASRLSELPRNAYLLIHCHHGGRSRRVTEFLLAQGFPRVSNVAGGIDAWAVEIEPGMRRY